jgi:hypothetical protein
MNKYILYRFEYSNPATTRSEVQASYHKFEEGRVNFYNNKDQLIKSYPSNLLMISKIKYKKVINNSCEK